LSGYFGGVKTLSLLLALGLSGCASLTPQERTALRVGVGTLALKLGTAYIASQMDVRGFAK